jgi:xylose isomerase
MFGRGFSSGLGTYGNSSDRFVGEGYKQDVSVDKMIGLAATVPEMKAVELISGAHFIPGQERQILSKLQDAGLEVSMVLPDMWTKRIWGKGSFTSVDKQTRRSAVDTVKKSVDSARELSCDLIDVWFGQDGWDYCFSQNYRQAWEWLIEGMIEVSDYAGKDFRIGIEYKLKEPRNFMYVSSVSSTLLFIRELQRDNIGVILDIGHAFQACESPAHSVALLNRFGNKLFHTHFNDNYRLWDDDMIASSVHVIEYVELIYWLQKTGYDGWYSLDIFPYREDGVKAAAESIAWIKKLASLAAMLSASDMESIINRDSATDALAMIRKHLFRD